MSPIDIIAAIFLIAYLGFTIWVINPSRLAKIDAFVKSHLLIHHTYITNEIMKAIAIIKVDQPKVTTTSDTTTKNNITKNSAQLMYFFLRAIKSPRMTSVAFYLFLLYTTSMLSVIIYLLSWKVIATIWIITSLVVVILLLTTSLVGNKSEYKKYDAYNQYNSIHHKIFEYIFSYIGLWVNTCIIKFLHVICNIHKANGIKCANNATDNHALHSDNLSQDKEQVNHKQTEPYCFPDHLAEASYVL